jgi:hypothetical protein
MMRRRAPPGRTRVAGLVAVAGLTGCAAVSGTARLAHRLPRQAFLSMFSAITQVRAIACCCDTREVLRPGRPAPGTTLRLRVQTSGPGPACPGTGPGPDTRKFTIRRAALSAGRRRI